MRRMRSRVAAGWALDPHERWVPTGIVDRRLQATRTLRRKYPPRSEEHTSELQSRQYLVCRLLLEKKKKKKKKVNHSKSKGLMKLKHNHEIHNINLHYIH